MGCVPAHTRVVPAHDGLVADVAAARAAVVGLEEGYGWGPQRPFELQICVLRRNPDSPH